MTLYHRRLPHWQPQGKTLFVTWRLHGTIPPHHYVLPHVEIPDAQDAIEVQGQFGPTKTSSVDELLSLLHPAFSGGRCLPLRCNASLGAERIDRDPATVTRIRHLAAAQAVTAVSRAAIHDPRTLTIPQSTDPRAQLHNRDETHVSRQHRTAVDA